MFRRPSLPGIDGHELGRRLRLQQSADLVIVARTGWEQDFDRLRSRVAGFDVHFTKPVDPAALEEVLSRNRHAGTSDGGDIRWQPIP